MLISIFLLPTAWVAEKRPVLLCLGSLLMIDSKVASNPRSRSLSASSRTRTSTVETQIVLLRMSTSSKRPGVPTRTLLPSEDISAKSTWMSLWRLAHESHPCDVQCKQHTYSEHLSNNHVNSKLASFRRSCIHTNFPTKLLFFHFAQGCIYGAGMCNKIYCILIFTSFRAKKSTYANRVDASWRHQCGNIKRGATKSF